MRTIVTLLLALHAVTFSATLHVGSGQTYANVQPAAGAAGPGDTILVHAGTYAGGQWISGLQGDQTRWITIRAFPGDTPIVDGGSEAWHLVDPAWVRVEGIAFQGQTSNGVNTDDGGDYATPAHHVVFERCTFRRMNATGNNDLLKLSGLDDFEIRQCVFEDGSAGGSGCDMVGCHRGLFTGNRFVRMGSNAIQAKGGSRHVTIERNYFEDCGERSVNLGGSTGLQYFRPDTAHYEAADLHVYANVFVGSQAPIAYVGCINTDVVNNTVFKPVRWVVRILQETVDTTRFAKCGYNTFRNNVVYRGTISTDCNIGPNTAPQTFTFSNNLWYNYQTPGSSAPRDLPVTDANAVIGQDPAFADTAGRNFAITSASPAAGQGMAVAQPLLDYLSKGYANPRSIGACEANPATVRRAPALQGTAGRASARTIARVMPSGDRRAQYDGAYLLHGRTAACASAAGLLLQPAPSAR